MARWKALIQVFKKPIQKLAAVSPVIALKYSLTFILGIGVSYYGLKMQRESVVERTPAAHIRPDEPILTPVVTKAIDIKTIQNYFTSYVTLKPWKQVKIMPKQNMTVKELMVSWGDEVKKGQSLALLDSEVHQLKEELQKLEYNLKLQEFKNVKKLAKKKFISRNEFMQKKMELKRQRLRKRISDLQSSSIKLVSPIDGIVSVVKLKTGDFIDSPSKYYIEVIDTASYKVELNLPQSVAGLIGVGEPVKLSRLGDANGDSDLVQGEISAVSPIVDPKSGSVFTEIEVIEPPMNWKTGMFVEVKFVTADEQDALVIPNESIIYKNDKPIVYRVIASEEGDAVEKVPDLEVGITDGIYTVVSGDLSAGDQIVVEGQGGLKDKLKVRVVN